MATTVREPVPRSCVPQRTSTVPSGLICASASLPLPPPPQPPAATPTPVLTGPGAAAGFLVFRGPAEAVAAFLVFALADVVGIVEQAELDRVHAQLHGQLVHHRFGAERRGRMTRCAEGAGGAGVHAETVLLDADVAGVVDARKIVEVRRGDAGPAAAACAFARAANAGRAVVDDIGGDQAAIRTGGKFDFLDGGGAVADGEALVETGEHHFDRRARGLGKPGGELVVIARAEFRAKTAAHVIANDFDVGLRHLQIAAEIAAYAEDALGR